MKKLFCISAKKGLSLEEAWQSLEMSGFEVLYGDEEEKGVTLYVQINEAEAFPCATWINSCEPYTLPPIDWEAQWAAHGADFHDGMVHLSHPPLRLKPGPGFGDLSHPTTRLVIKLMREHLHHESFIDIGCGSGILSIAAAVLGASEVIGIDIDEEALKHSAANAQLNGVEKITHFYLPENFKRSFSEPVLIVMNMISSEQQMAWHSLPSLHSCQGKRITSGIRKEEQKKYLQQTAKWGWDLIQEEEEQEWLGFCFTS